MLLSLLKRDLKLHRMLLMPSAVTILFCGYLGTMRSKDVVFFAFGLALLATILLPLTFHLREEQEGTLAELTSLPIARHGVVRLRFLEALLFPLAVLAILGLVGLLIGTPRTGTETSLASIVRNTLHAPLGLAWFFFWCFAYPLPATFRWGLKGLVPSVVAPIALLFTVGVLAFHPSTAKTVARLWAATGRAPWHWIEIHQPLVVTLLIALFFMLSIKAFKSRNF
jgi:hypothetical protein